MDSFATSHPLINFLFFVGALGVTMFCLHPVILAISYLSGIAYAICVKGWRHVVRLTATFVLPGFIIVALLNPAFNHYGVTLLLTLPDGNSVTLEAIVYGLALAAVLAASVTWFISANAVLTRDKFTHSVGKIFATGALIISMSFRFIPLFTQHFRSTLEAQRYIGRDIRTARLKEKVSIALNVTSALFTWSLENAIHVSDSMRARGYGSHKRTSYSLYRWNRQGVIIAVMQGVLIVIVIVSILMGGLTASYNPVIAVSGFGAEPATVWTWSGIASFALFSTIPLLMRAEEAVRWSRYERKGIVASADLPLPETPVPGSWDHERITYGVA